MEVCKAIARNTNRKFKGPETDLSYPKGCYVYMGKIVVWNKHSTGGTNKDATPVCKMS